MTYSPDPTSAEAFLTPSGFLEHRKYGPDDKPLWTAVEVMSAYQQGLRDGEDKGRSIGRTEALAELSYSWSCAHRMWDDPNGARCANKDRHEEHTGQCWAVSSDAPDRHDSSEARQD